MGNLLSFSLGMQDAGFGATVKASDQQLKAFTNSVKNFSRGLNEGGAEMLGMREKSEILRHSLQSVGGVMGPLGDLARLALDPMTIGFAAVFGAIDLYNRSMEAASERMEEFIKTGVGVENIIKGIIAARHTGTDDWIEQVKEMAKSSQHGSNLNFFADESQKVQTGEDKNTADAAMQQIELEQKKVELLRDQHKISQQDADSRIASLKAQAVLQKNLNEQNAIKHQISGRQSDLDEISKQAAQNPVNAAFTKKQAADAKVADLQKQLEDLPKAIQGQKQLATEAGERSKQTYLDPHERGRWLDQWEVASNRATTLQGQFDKAKSEFVGAAGEQASAGTGLENAEMYKKRGLELTQQITGLKNDLGVTQGRQRKMTPGELQAIALEKQEKTQKMLDAHPYKPDFTSLEKMGFVMGGKDAGLDFARRTAVATEKMSRNFNMSQISGFNFNAI